MTAQGLIIPLLVAAAIFDVKSRRIPNWLTGLGALLGFVIHGVGEGAHGILASVEGLLLGVVFLAPFYLKGGMGAGDVKLMGAIGALLGPKGVFLAFLFSALAGGLCGVFLLAVRGCLGETVGRFGAMARLFRYSGRIEYLRPTEKESGVLIPYGVPIAVGTFLSVLKGSSVL
jgi:prepilin peptidase CpaA